MQNSYKALSLSSDETYEFGVKIGKQLKKADLIFLDGELGTGKTNMTRGLVDGLCPEKGVFVSSPTYVIMQRYPVENNIVYHLDLYRLENEEELADLGFQDFIASDAIVVVEWANKFGLKEKHSKCIHVALSHSGDDKREILVSWTGDRTFTF